MSRKAAGTSKDKSRTSLEKYQEAKTTFEENLAMLDRYMPLSNLRMRDDRKILQEKLDLLEIGYKAGLEDKG